MVLGSPPRGGALTPSGSVRRRSKGQKKGRAGEAPGHRARALPYVLPARASDLGATPAPSRQARRPARSRAPALAHGARNVGEGVRGRGLRPLRGLPVALPLAGPRAPQSGGSRLPRPPRQAEGSEARGSVAPRQGLTSVPLGRCRGDPGRQGRARRAQPLSHPFPARLPGATQWQAVAADLPVRTGQPLLRPPPPPPPGRDGRPTWAGHVLRGTSSPRGGPALGPAWACRHAAGRACGKAAVRLWGPGLGAPSGPTPWGPRLSTASVPPAAWKAPRSRS